MEATLLNLNLPASRMNAVGFIAFAVLCTLGCVAAGVPAMLYASLWQYFGSHIVLSLGSLYLERQTMERAKDAALLLNAIKVVLAASLSWAPQVMHGNTVLTGALMAWTIGVQVWVIVRLGMGLSNND